MSRWSKWVAAGAFLALAGCFYASPYLAFRGMQAAAERRDAAALSAGVDFPALRQSLKAGFDERVRQAFARRPGDRYAAIGVAFAQSFVEKLVDAMVTPEGVAMMMDGRSQPESASRAGSSREAAPQPAGGERVVGMGWESLDRFAVRVVSREDPAREVGLVLLRHGLTWKLSAVRLPAL